MFLTLKDLCVYGAEVAEVMGNQGVRLDGAVLVIVDEYGHQWVRSVTTAKSDLMHTVGMLETAKNSLMVQATVLAEEDDGDEELEDPVE